MNDEDLREAGDRVGLCTTTISLTVQSTPLEAVVGSLSPEIQPAEHVQQRGAVCGPELTNHHVAKPFDLLSRAVAIFVNLISFW